AFFRVPEDDFSLPQAFIDRCAPLWHPDITPDRNRILMKELSLAFNRSFSLDLFRKAVGPVIADTIKNKYAPQQSIDLFAMTSAIAIRFAVRVVFGKRFYDEHVDDLIKMVKPLEEDIMSPINSFFPGWPLPPNRRMAKFSATMKKWIDREIGLRIDSGFKDDGGNKMDDYLQHLLDSQVYRDFAFAIVPHASMILIAAHTNTAGTIGWTSYHLARDPQLQSEVRAQLDAEKATTTETRVATMPTTTAAMDLFSACIKESGRRYVPVYLLRTVMHDTEFQGYFLRAGENLAIGTACMALDPAVFDSPLKYDPRRWMDGRTDSIVHGREVAMFGAGKHKCLGERLALMTFRQVMFPALLGDYRIELVDGVDAEEALPDYFSTVSTPFSSKPVHVRLVPLAK
ncbi:cytochrome P450, partial [Entophlyctis helioformis]